MAFLYIENYSKRFDNTIIYSNLNLKFDNAEWVFISGQSGVGKTVLLKSIRDNDMGINRFNKTVRYVRQQPTVFNWMNVEQNIKFGNVLCSEFDEIVDILQLTNYLSRFPNQLSGGQLQRVSLARALLEKRDIYLFDESLSSVDTTTSKLIIEALSKKLNSCLCLFVTHNIELIQYYDFRVLNFKETSVSEEKGRTFI